MSNPSTEAAGASIATEMDQIFPGAEAAEDDGHRADDEVMGDTSETKETVFTPDKLEAMVRPHRLLCSLGHPSTDALMHVLR